MKSAIRHLLQAILAPFGLHILSDAELEELYGQVRDLKRMVGALGQCLHQARRRRRRNPFAGIVVPDGLPEDLQFDPDKPERGERPRGEEEGDPVG